MENKNDDLNFTRKDNLLGEKVKDAVIVSDYYLRNGVHQDIRKILTLDDVDTLYHLVINLQNKRPLCLATYNCKTNDLIIHDVGMKYFFMNKNAEIYSFIDIVKNKNVEVMEQAESIVKKKVMRAREHEIIDEARLILKDENVEKRRCYRCGRWFPNTFYYFPSTKLDYELDDNNEIMPKCLICFNRQYNKLREECRKKTKLARMERKKQVEAWSKMDPDEIGERYWKNRTGEYLVGGINVFNRKEFLTTLYDLAGLNFHDIMESHRNTLQEEFYKRLYEEENN